MSTLYPTTVITELEPNNLYHIDSGNLFAFPFDVVANTVTRFDVVHVAYVQDHSLRCWFSQFPAGINDTFTSSTVSFWHPNRNLNLTLRPLVYDESLPAPGEICVGMAPGRYYLNILNLINLKNSFTYSLTDL